MDVNEELKSFCEDAKKKIKGGGGGSGSGGGDPCEPRIEGFVQCT